MTISLTSKEKEILKLRSMGVSNIEISKKLDVTPTDISQTFKRISKKLTSVNETLQLLHENGLMEEAHPIMLTDKGVTALEKITKIESKPSAIIKGKYVKNKESGESENNLPLFHINHVGSHKRRLGLIAVNESANASTLRDNLLLVNSTLLLDVYSVKSGMAKQLFAGSLE